MEVAALVISILATAAAGTALWYAYQSSKVVIKTSDNMIALAAVVDKVAEQRHQTAMALVELNARFNRHCQGAKIDDIVSKNGEGFKGNEWLN